MLSLRTLLNLTPRSLRVVPSANVMWPAKFEEPLKSREEIGQIQKTPEYERKVNVPVKAAAQDASCSMFQDPLLQKFIKICTVTSSAQLGEQIWLETCRRIKVLTIVLFFYIYSCHMTLSLFQEIQLAKYYAASEDKRKDIELNPSAIIRGAIENCRPLMSLQKVKVGSVTYYVPTPITESR